MKPLLIREELLNRKIRIFSNQEFSQIFKLSQYQAEFALNRLIKEGLLIRIKKGYYVLKIDPPCEEEIANALYKPSYVSFEYALAYYGIIPEVTYQITSATTKSTRLFIVNNIAYSYYTIKAEAYTGYILAQREEKRFYIAEPEKALVDYLYIVSLKQRVTPGRRSLNDRIELSSINKNKVHSYTKLYNWSNLNELVEEVLKP
ncbi:MAG: type IV toxin-antitoxin system AbiEi family antitoxin domain-containing protein [Candidatus Daviesbacteria bacterium]|nr:type IV toxin-antitoxin system AbiEi family antitoxin domain-containing protein [Candidatus Daviesbacteria bacterium]